MPAFVIYLFGSSLFTSLCTIYTLYWACKHRLHVFCIGYAVSACSALALTVLSVISIISVNADFARAINALVCLIVGVGPLIQSQHLNHVINKGFRLRSLFGSFRIQCFLKGLELPFRQHVLANAYFSITAACGKFAAALMLMFAILSFRSCGQAKLMLNRMSYKSGATSVILFFGTAFEYSILAVMLFNWTFSQMGYKALLNHFGCFIFATAGFLALAILTAQCKGTAVFDLYLWTGHPLTSVIQIWLSAVHKTHEWSSPEQSLNHIILIPQSEYLDTVPGINPLDRCRLQSPQRMYYRRYPDVTTMTKSTIQNLEDIFEISPQAHTG